MDFRLFGVGPGVLILVLLWASTFLVCVSLGKTHGITAVIGLSVLSSLLSLALISWPTEKMTEALYVTEITRYDQVFIPRLILVILLAIIVVVVLAQHLTRSVLSTTSVSNAKNRHKHVAFNDQY